MIILIREKKGHTLTIMIDLDKDRLVEIPPSGWPPDRMKNFSEHLKRNDHKKNATT